MATSDAATSPVSRRRCSRIMFISQLFRERRHDSLITIRQVIMLAETAMQSVPTPSIADTRQDQMFPTLELSEIERVRRFGQLRTFAPGEALAKVGDRSGA